MTDTTLQPPDSSDRHSVMRRIIRGAAPACVVLALLAVHAPAAQGADGKDTAAAQALHRLLDDEWEWRLAQFPERATYVGDHRYDDRVTDRSPAAIAARRAHHRDELAAIHAIDRAKLKLEIT